jgi:hypothetical protein
MTSIIIARWWDWAVVCSLSIPSAATVTADADQTVHRQLREVGSDLLGDVTELRFGPPLQRVTVRVGDVGSAQDGATHSEDAGHVAKAEMLIVPVDDAFIAVFETDNLHLIF